MIKKEVFEKVQKMVNDDLKEAYKEYAINKNFTEAMNYLNLALRHIENLMEKI